MRVSSPPEELRKTALSALSAGGSQALAGEWGIDRKTFAKIAQGDRVAVTTLSKIIERTRKASDFVGAVPARAPRRRQPIGEWNLERIREARDAQMLGNFSQAVRLAEAMRTDDALYTAYHNRIAPQSAVQTTLVPCDGARGEIVQRKATASCFVSRGVLEGIAGTMANHGIAIGYVTHEISDDGTRVDLRLAEWPLEFVKWNPFTELLETLVRDGGMRVPIVHGDGHWIKFQKFDVLPWTQEAAILPGSLIWGAHAYALSDWAGASRSHGLAKMIGELPPGVSTQKKDSTGTVILSDEATAFLDLMASVMSGNDPFGIRPAGSKTDVVTNASNMWQVFSELILNREKAIARVYLGTDAYLGASGDAPGVDIATLFAVASTKLQGDFDAIEQALNTGLYQVWTAINCGDSRYSPRFEYQVPDPDATGKSEETAAKRTRLFDALDRMRALNLDITQADVETLASAYGVENPPRLGSSGATQLQLPDSVVSSVTLGREGRAAQGLPPFGDERDAMTIDEIAIYAKGRADVAVAKIKAAATIATAQSAPAPTDQNTPAKDPPPLTGAVKLELAPTDVARIVRVREARAAEGLPPFGDARDDLTLPELDAAAKAKADIQVKSAPDPSATAPANAPPPPLANA